MLLRRRRENIEVLGHPIFEVKWCNRGSTFSPGQEKLFFSCCKEFSTDSEESVENSA